MSYNKSNPLTANSDSYRNDKILRKGRKEIKNTVLLCVLCVFSHRSDSGGELCVLCG